MAKLTIPGSKNERLKNQPVRTGQFMDVTVREAIDLTMSRGSNEQETLQNIKEDDILQLILEDGTSWYGTLADYKEQFAPPVKRSTRGADEIFLSPSIDSGDTSRGILGNIVIKAVRVLGVDPVKIAADAFVKKIESQLCDDPGLYLCPDPSQTLQPIKENLDIAAGTYLLLIHGTGSCTSGSFGGFTTEGTSTTWHNLQRIYEGRILAYEHKTVSMSPLENVRELLEQLPKNINLHLVTHSRGGLVGEILARGAAKKQLAFSGEDIEVFENDEKARTRDIATMKALNKMFDEKNITVERFVRVACPTAGTLLASKRLDRYLNVLVNILEKIPGMKGNPFFEFITSWFLATVKKRTDPNDLPGVEAMMPTSPLVRVLNNPNIEIDSSLSVLAGDVKRGGFKRTMMVLAADLYYRAKHDFVVNTAAMYRGTPRIAERAFYFYDEGKTVDHFHYFINQKTRNAIEAALLGKTTSENGFQPMYYEDGIPSLPSTVRSTGNKPVVYLLPGIMGSHLSVPNKKIWVKLKALAGGRMKDLAIENEEVFPSGLVERAYKDIYEYLNSSHEVIPFAFDWRKSLFDEADRLIEHMQETMATSDQPIRILAHSMGGLLARVMMSKPNSPWKKIIEDRPGSRFIMLGTPNGGSHAIGRVLCGQEKMFRILHLLDLKNNKKQVLDIVSKYPGLLQLLPNENYDHIDGVNFFEVSTWKILQKLSKGRLEMPKGDLIREAKKLGATLKATPLDPDHCYYVAGKAKSTPFALRETDKGEYKFIGTSRGDGRVPWDSGIPEELKENNTWYMDTDHGALANDKDAFPAILDLLQRGNTDRQDILSKEAIALRGSTEVETVFPEEDPVMFPDEFELEAAVLGFEPTREIEVSSSKVRVTVTYGDLANAQFPVAVGHFKGDGIVSAESVLDHYLGGRLSERHRMGIYPGEIESCEIIIDPEEDPPGALVVCLGNYGELTSGDLSRSFAHAALSMAIAQRETQLRHGSGKEIAPPNRISTLLIGSGYAGLDMRTGIRALLTGIQVANARIKGLGIPQMPIIDEIEFIEIYQNRAVQAAKLMQRLLKEDQFKRDFAFKSPHLRVVGGGYKRIQYDDNSSWWHRVKVESVKKVKIYENEDPQAKDHKVEIKSLKFTSLTDRARGEEVNQPDHRRLVDSMIEQSIQYTDWNPDAAQAMFELLMPNQFKDYASERKNILWIVDEESAHYPWELLVDPSLGDQEEPMAVQAGMLRQLTTTEFRGEVDMTTERRALVIGDPVSNFPKLPAAVKEANLVKGLFETNDFDVISSIEEHAPSVLMKLFKQRYQIIHIAAHGEYDKFDPSKTGVVIGDHDFITPGIIKQLRWVPDLVFVNCCHLGNIEANDNEFTQVHKLAANLGTQLIRMGVKAVVVAGWAVNDAAAELFAQTFYNKMFVGSNFGYAIQAARKAAYDKYRQNITWGAYQAYGDPFFTLRKRQGGGGSWRPDYVDPMEAVIDIENIISKAASAYGRSHRNLINDLETIIEYTPKPWLSKAYILEKIARAYTDLGLIEKGLQYYESVLGLDKSEYTVAGLEQLANLRARGAVALINQPTTSKREYQQNIRKADTQISLAIKEITRLNEIFATAPRFNLLGSAFKRKAIFLELSIKDEHNSKTRRTIWEALIESSYNYKRALDITEEKTNMLDHYPLLNWLAVVGLLEWLLPKDIETIYDPKKKRNALQKSYDEKLFQMPNVMDIKEELAQAYKAAQVRDQARPDFFEYSAMATFDIFYLLIRDNNGIQPLSNEELMNRAVQSYERAWSRSGSNIKRLTVKEHMEFIITMLDPGLLHESLQRGRKSRIKDIVKKQAMVTELMTRLMSVMR